MKVYVLVLEIKKMLRNLDEWLRTAGAHAEARKFDGKVLVQARLAPDMFPLARQVQSACDTAKFAAARLTGLDAPSHPDTETTLGELSTRIATVLAYLDTVAEADLADIEHRTVTLRFLDGKSMTAVDYLVEHALPNFFFHVTTAYAILRHNGVDLGKRVFLGTLTVQ